MALMYRCFAKTRVSCAHWTVWVFEEIFDIIQEVPTIDAELHSIESVSPEVDEIRRQVVEAHKLLMELNPDNSKEFTDLIRALESDQ